MAGRLVVKPLEKVSPVDYKKIQRLNFGSNGSMRFELDNAKRRIEQGKKSNTDIIMIKDRDRVIAWSLVFPEGQKKVRTAYFYTRAKERNKGYGKRLMRAAQKVQPKPHICPHDYRSAGFFKNFASQTRYDRWNYYMDSVDKK